MYLMATHIPIYVLGNRTFLDDSWFSDVDLARQYFVPSFGKLAVLGPSMPVTDDEIDGLREVSDLFEDLELHPSIDIRTQVRKFWPAALNQWKRDMAPLLEKAEVVHASVDDPFRPMQLTALRESIKAGKNTVLVGFDMDPWTLFKTQLGQLSLINKAMHVVRTFAEDFWMRRLVKKATVSMLKQGEVYKRYSPYARNPKGHCHSMHFNKHVMSEEAFEARLEDFKGRESVRFVYCGRFIERKGLIDAFYLVAKLKEMGLDVTYDLVGGGPQQKELEDLSKTLGISDIVHFVGSIPYGDALHEQLRRYDALLFMPTEEDTPRMVYDVYASGLPLFTTNIPFLEYRSSVDKSSLLMDIGAVDEGAKAIKVLVDDKDAFIALSRNAYKAGKSHTVEFWYGTRLNWTLEALGRQSEVVPL